MAEERLTAKTGVIAASKDTPVALYSETQGTDFSYLDLTRGLISNLPTFYVVPSQA